MAHDPLWMDLRCRPCGWVLVCGLAEMTGWLTRHGALRRNLKPGAEEVRQLFCALCSGWKCPSCGQSGLTAAEAPPEEDAFPGTRRCADCQAPLDAQRLEIFPNAALCMRCQQQEEKGGAAVAEEYCPRCGSPQVLRATRGAGLSRYVLICTAGCR